MRVSLLLIVSLLLASTSGEVRAQNTGDGSVYSAFGLGELTRFGTSQSRAMGGGGFALHSHNYANFGNPAALSNQVLTRLATGIDFQSVHITDGAANEGRLNQGALAAVQLSFPIIDERLGVGFGLAPYSRVSYRIRQEGTIVQPDTVRYGVDSEGRGGLQTLSGAVGYNFGPVSVGASVGYLFGILENGRRTFFVGGEYQNIEVMNHTRLGGVTATLGTQMVLPRPFRSNDLLRAGATFTIPTTLSGDRVRTVGLSLDRDTLGVVTPGEASIPWAIDAGVAYNLDRRWLFVLDGSFSPWSQFESTLAFNGYQPGASTMRDRMRVSVGSEFTPGGGDQLTTYFRRSSYRLGAYADRSYVDPTAAFDLMTYALTGGISLPTFLSGTRLDVNMEVGTRGTTDHGLVRDVFYRLSASVNIGERWFERRRLR
jgi:hypothetical protein